MSRRIVLVISVFVLMLGCTSSPSECECTYEHDDDVGHGDADDNTEIEDVGDDVDEIEDTGGNDDVTDDVDDEDTTPSENQVDPPPGTLVIMPLGDSMTNDSRPRVTLWNLLEDDGHELDYVGDQSQGSSIPDDDHEGVGGIKIHEIADKTEHLMTTHEPEYVALMVGTNDIAWYFDETGEEIADRWNDLVELIFEHSDADTYVIAATIPPVTSQNVGQDSMPERDRAVLVSHYNAAIRDHVDARIDDGDLIILADMEAALDVDDHVSGDGVHLNDTGYTIMGTVYYNAITEALIAQQD